MNDRPVQRLREEIDACRFASEDLRDPRFAELAEAVRRNAEVRRQFESVQRFDAQIARAMQDVEIPEGLEHRLLDALGLNGPQLETDDDGPSSPGVTVVARRPALDRRTWLWSAGVAGAAAALLVGVWWLAGRQRVRQDILVDQWALSWVNRVQLDDVPPWRPWEPTSAADPVWHSLAVTPRRWTDLSTELSRSTIAYDLADAARRGRALLFVADTRRNLGELPAYPPPSPQHSTGPWVVAAWHNGQRVYVLAFEGNPGRYQQLLGTSSRLADSGDYDYGLAGGRRAAGDESASWIVRFKNG
jgi:hypothetical protein